MSTIKPPGGPPGPRGTAPAAGPEAHGAERAGATFRDALQGPERAGAAAPAAVQASTAPGGADPIADLAQAVRSGALSADQAIERLVERAAAGVERALSPAQRAELTSILRSAVQTDPALRALRDALP